MSNKMLIDEFLPNYDFSEKHEINIRTSAEKVYQAVNSVNLADSWVIWSLLNLRGLGRSSGKTLTLRDMTKDGFAILGEKPNEEILIGLAGKFWTLTGSLQNINAENFRDFQTEGFAKAVWNFSLTKKSDEEIRLSTETRIQCLGDSSLSKFSFYWRFIQPFSGLIRNEMLRLIKQKAETEQK
jgi:hypothetical protein